MKCRVTIFLLLGWAALSALGYMGRNDIYRKYRQDVWTKPYFVMVFEGIHDGIWPWMMSGMPWSDGAGPQEPGDLALLPGTEEAEDQSGVAAGTGNAGAGTAGASGTEHAGAGTDGTAPGTEAVVGSEGTAPGTAMGTENAAPGTGSAAGTEAVGEPATEEAPLPKQFVQVDQSWFDDAVFIGDSRTVGLRDYGGLTQATFYATVGMNVYDMWTEKFCEVDGEKLTLEEALTKQQFGKVYFQMGINEMGTGTIDSFMEAYAAAVERLKELQPDAIIYVQGIMRVTQKKSDADPIFNNRGILLRNERIALLADQIRVFYIDMNEAVCNNEGNLREDLTFDDLHLYGSKYGIWVDFLLTKGVE